MTLDHVAILFLERGTTLYFIFRVLGRPAMPIACFLLAIGFAKTSNRKRYALRIFLTALIAELFWIYLWSMQRIEAMENVTAAFEAAGGETAYPATDTKSGLEVWFNTLTSSEQVGYTGWIIPVLNILFTFLICMGMLAVVQKIKDKFGDVMPKQFMHNLGFLGCMGGTVMVTLMICILCPLPLDYAVEAPMIVLVCYMFRDERKTMGIMLTIIALFMGTQSLYYALSTLLGVVCIYFYNGELGYDKTKHPIVRTLFYAYYPVHLAILVESRYFHEIYSNFFGR
jgi:TraX protein.